MEVLILDQEFNQVCVIDTFESLLWTERYNEAGEFELYMPVNTALLNLVRQDYYVWMKDSDETMIIEEIKIETSADSGSKLVYKGRSLASILDRRIIWNEFACYHANLQDCIGKLLDRNVINPSVENRKIPGFIFEKSDDPEITKLTLDARFDGENLYDTIVDICQSNSIGFRVYLNDDNKFVFKLYVGEDRSYEQSKNPYVVFSPKFENLLSSEYMESDKTYKNMNLVVGLQEIESEDNDETVQVIRRYPIGNLYTDGLERREMYTDATDIDVSKYREVLTADREILDKLLEMVSYNTRIASFQKRISYYQNLITDYKNALAGDQLTSFNKRETYKTKIKQLEASIKKHDDKISDYNDKLNNEENLAYSKLVEYETGIKTEEKAKESLEEQKKTNEENKSKEEEQLPNFQEKLSKYESMIEKYEGIIQNDQNALAKIDLTLEEERTPEELAPAYEQKIVEDQEAMDKAYYDMMFQRGKDGLSENTSSRAFSAEVEPIRSFLYGQDFFKGDIVQIINEYGMVERGRMIEFVRSQDTSGYNAYPTFSIVEESKGNSLIVQ